MLFDLEGTLWIFTLLTVVLAGLLWAKTRTPAFAIGAAALYFWSLYGGWAILDEKVHGVPSGFHFHHLEQAMFPINADGDYLAAVQWYGIFVALTLATTLVMVRRPRPECLAHSGAFHIDHRRVIALTALAGIASYLLVRDSFERAAAMNMAAYLLTRMPGEVPFFSIHTILNRAALFPALIGFAVLASGRHGRVLKSPGASLPILAGYLGVVGGMGAMLMLLGNKSELFTGTLAAVLFYLANCPRPQYSVLALSGMGMAITLGVIELTRGRALLAGAGVEADLWQMATAFLTFVKSNEAFGAHLSLYGVFHMNVPVKFGNDLISLLASVVPRDLWSERPPEAYLVYAEGAQFTSDQGFSIHHATGWYLTFGFFGILIGAILLGAIWAGTFNSFWSSFRRKTAWGAVFSALSPWMLTGYFPALLRGGPTGYKGVILEAFLLPVLVIGFAAYRERKLAQDRQVCQD